MVLKFFSALMLCSA